jgi:DHA2 family multidrug resistance protein
VILPGAIASAITMALMGRFGPNLDARLSIVTGVLLFAWAMWLHYHFTPEIGRGDLLLPMILRGVGLGCIFIPLTNAAVADLRPQQLPQGTGLFNLSRQLGGSFGIAVTATLITRFREQSRIALLPHLAPDEPTVRTWLEQVTGRMLLQGGSLAEAQLKAARLLEFRLQQQASTIAFEKIFLLMGSAFFFALPLLLLIRVGKSRRGGMAH